MTHSRGREGEGSRESSYRLTVPLLRQRNCDFSFSGLKNGFRIAVEGARTTEKCGGNESNAPKRPNTVVKPEETVALSEAVAADLCAGFQQAAFRHAEDR